MGYCRILIIDSNQAESQFIALQLNALDYRVTLANGTRAGFHSLIHDFPDLIILESCGETGEDFCRSIRQYSELPIIAIGDTQTKFEELRYLEAGADDFLCKPFSSEILSLKIKAILRRRKAGIAPEEIRQIMELAAIKG